MADLVTDKGLAIVVDRLFTSLVYTAQPKFVAWGTGSTQTVASNALAVESAEARTDGTSSTQTTDTTGDTYRVVGTITATAARAITEAGLFDASTVGNMFVYSDFIVINLATNDSITFTFNVQFNQ